MPRIVGVRFRPVTKIYYFDPNKLKDIEVETRVIVETSRGIEMGTVVQPVHEVPKSEIKGKLKRVIRKATPVDLLQVERYRVEEQQIMERCNRFVREMEVPIRIIKADYNLDGSRLIFSFTAEQRVDFRSLVKKLTREFNTRIEMKQVGARDETKILDGYGRCGRRLCCSSWLTEFHPVSIKMAKQQNLPLAPAEISGLCGRLLCCLAYENEQYTEIRKTLPKVGSRVKTQQETTGMIRGLNVLSETLILKMDDDEGYLEVPAQEVEVIEGPKSSKKGRKRKQKK